MNFKTTVILIVLLAAVGIYLVVDHFVSVPRTDEQTAGQTGLAGEGRRIFDADAGKVIEVRITPANGKKIVLQKSDGQWKITEPIEAPAAKFEVDDFVRSLVELRSHGQVQATGDKAAAAGLDHPLYQIELKLESGPELHLAIGQRAAIGDMMYVQVQGSHAADLVSADLWPRLQNPADQLRDKRLVTASATDIHQLQIHTSNANLQLQKQGDQWQLTSPTTMPAEQSAVSDLLFDITGLQASEFVAPDSPEVARMRFDHPQATVFFSTTPPSTQPATAPAGVTITFGAYENSLRDKVYVKLSNSTAIAKVPASALTSLSKTPLELRDKRVVDIDPATVSELELVIDQPATTQPATRPASQRTITLHRQVQPSTTTQATSQPISHWVLASESNVPADDVKVDAILSALHPLRVERYLEQPLTLEPADTYTLNIHVIQAGSAERSTHTLSLIEKDSTGPLIGSYNGLTFEVDRGLLAKLQADFHHPAPASTTQATH